MKSLDVQIQIQKKCNRIKPPHKKIDKLLKFGDFDFYLYAALKFENETEKKW